MITKIVFNFILNIFNKNSSSIQLILLCLLIVNPLYLVRHFKNSILANGRILNSYLYDKTKPTIFSPNSLFDFPIAQLNVNWNNLCSLWTIFADNNKNMFFFIRILYIFKRFLVSLLTKLLIVNIYIFLKIINNSLDNRPMITIKIRHVKSRLYCRPLRIHLIWIYRQHVPL